MSYDLFWIPSSVPLDQVKSTLHGSEQPAPQFDAQRDHVIVGLRALDATLQWRPSIKGGAYGGWLGSESNSARLPDFDVAPRYFMTSGHPHGDMEQVAEYFRPVFEVFRKNGYNCFDPQTGRLLTTYEEFRQNLAGGSKVARASLTDRPVPMWAGFGVLLLLGAGAKLFVRRRDAARNRQDPERGDGHE